MDTDSAIYRVQKSFLEYVQNSRIALTGEAALTFCYNWDVLLDEMELIGPYFSLKEIVEEWLNFHDLNYIPHYSYSHSDDIQFCDLDINAVDTITIIYRVYDYPFTDVISKNGITVTTLAATEDYILNESQSGFRKDALEYISTL